jgi:osmoprotectant transport system ATP-binding protein
VIEFADVSKVYPDGTVAVERLNLEIPTGKLTILIGPSGCGKTTSMRMINRLIEPTSGAISLDGVDTRSINRVSLRRKIGYVIQNAGLFPHRTIVDNISSLPRLLGAKKSDARSNALELLERVGLDVRLANRYPWQLSGGQQQRVGVARALATDPPILLMDEPFSAVDPITRNQLQDEFLRLQSDIGKTIVMVTHDIDEALKLGDQVAVLREGGVLAQVSSPAHLLAHPSDPFVADFVGTARGYHALGFVAAGESVPITEEPTVRIGDYPGDRARTADGWIVAVNNSGAPLGWIQVDSLANRTVEASDVNISGTVARASGTLRDLLNSALSSPNGRGIVADDHGTLLGTVDTGDIVLAIRRAKTEVLA